MRWFDPIMAYSPLFSATKKARDCMSVVFSAIDKDPAIEDPQKARYLLTDFILRHMTTILPTMNAQLASKATTLALPQSTTELDNFFPGELQFKQSSDPLPPFWKARKVSAEYLKDLYNKISDSMRSSGKNVNVLNERFSGLFYNRCISTTAYPIGPEFKSFKRDYGRVVLAIILEEALAKEYRAPLLVNGVAFVRSAISTIMLDVAKVTNTIPTKSRKGGPVKRWEFVDLLGVPEKTSLPSIPEILKSSAISEYAAQNVNEANRRAIQSLITKVEGNPLARASLGEPKGKGPVAASVSKALKDLAQVRVMLSFLRHIGILSGPLDQRCLSPFWRFRILSRPGWRGPFYISRDSWRGHNQSELISNS
jgi:hypothetical protein